METSKFMLMLNDKNLFDLNKMKYKYSLKELDEFLSSYKSNYLTSISCSDFKGESILYNRNLKEIKTRIVKRLLQHHQDAYAIKAMEDEIVSSFKIENIASSRESIRRILNGLSPNNQDEEKIYSMKKGIEYISNKEHKITATNLSQLYRTAIMPSVDKEDHLIEGNMYRHDSVMIVGSKVEHVGLDNRKVPDAMNQLIKYIDEESEMNDLNKAAVIHFMIAYIHPYFDGNGRMARLLHLWYLIQNDFSSILYVSLAQYIEKSKSEYYKAFKVIEENEKISKFLDITPFLLYFINCVYNKIENKREFAINEQFEILLNAGKITEKEKSLWLFIQMNYGLEGFSTKQLEKDYGDAAYATIYNFVNKFESYDLLKCEHYSNRRKFFIKVHE